MRNKRILFYFSTLLLLLPTKTLFSQLNSLEDTASVGPNNGTLLIMGGGAMTPELWDLFKKEMGGVHKHLVIIPTALMDEQYDKEYGEQNNENFKKRFINQGFTNITILHTRNKEEANSEQFYKVLETASGVWFSGGRQWRFADSYLNTKTHEALFRVLERGGIIAGGSAGATIQGSYLARGDTKSNTILMGDHEEGLAFIKNTAIDQHLLTRNRQNDMFEILDNKPKLLGIGIDESTGILVKKDRFTVVGESYVAIYDGTRWSKERDTIYTLPKNSREFYYLKAGDEYDLKKRKVVLYEDRNFISISKAALKKYTGTYKLARDSAFIKISIKKNKLIGLQTWDKVEYVLVPVSPSKFFIKNSDVFFEFEINFLDEINSFYNPSHQGTWIRIED